MKQELYPRLAISNQGGYSSLAYYQSANEGPSFSLKEESESIECLSGLIAEFLESNSEKPRLVIVSLGPGSYTGVRSCLALGLGLSQGFSSELVGIPLMSAAIAFLNPNEQSGTYQVVFDATRDKYYSTEFVVNPESSKTQKVHLDGGREYSLVDKSSLTSESDNSDMLNLSELIKRSSMSLAQALAETASYEGDFGIKSAEQNSLGSKLKPIIPQPLNAKTLKERGIST